jgi:hypothetical protein
MAIILLLLGAILGVAVDRICKASYSIIVKSIQRSRNNRRLKAANRHAITNWLLDYYGTTDLHRCSISGTSKTIPFFVDVGWIYCVSLDSIGKRVVLGKQSDHSSFKVDHRLISLRELHGQKVFNNPTFYTRAITFQDGVTQIEIARTEYYHIITNLIALEEETFKSILSGKRHVPLRDQYFRDRATAKAMGMRPLSFGVNVGFVLKSGTGLEILLQVRSNQTVTYGGSKALFPCFGLAPIENDGTLSSDAELYYNFVKEYLEEFFDYEELVDKLSEKRADPLWFMELPEAVEIAAARRNGKLKLVVLGFGMDCLSGTTSLSMLVELSDMELGRKIVKNTVGNWEVASPTVTEESLELLDLFSPKLGQYLENDLLHYGSAFTLERIQQYYREERSLVGTSQPNVSLQPS